MRKKVNVADVAARAKAADQEARSAATDSAARSLDSFTNFAQSMGVGANNPLSSAGYGFNPISRLRTTLEWIHRGSWIGGVAVDVVADDMTRAGVSLQGDLDPGDIEQLEENITQMNVWGRINETIKWARLYGGCIAVLLIDGQETNTPLRVNTIRKGQFRGLLVLDRWMIDPSLNDLVTEMGPDLGLPKYYTIVADAPALPRLKIHHSRCIRLVGTQLPYWQRIMENLWGTSVLERLYDRLIAFDSASTGTAQLVYKAYIRTYKIKGLREIVAAGGAPMQGLTAYVQMMQQFQGIEGITLMDGDDEFEGIANTSFSGLSEALKEFKEQLSGALQIPLVRLFGQSPSGFSTGDSDLRLYYDGIAQKQNDELLTGITKVYRIAAASLGITLPDGFAVRFKSLWQLDDKGQADVAAAITGSIVQAHEAGLISDKVAMQELRQSATTTGLFSNISDDDIGAASETIEAPEPEGMPGEEKEQSTEGQKE